MEGVAKPEIARQQVAQPESEKMCRANPSPRKPCLQKRCLEKPHLRKGNCRSRAQPSPPHTSLQTPTPGKAVAGPGSVLLRAETTPECAATVPSPSQIGRASCRERV